MTKTIVLLAVSAFVLAMAPAAQAEVVVHYKLDETSGTTASDATGNGNNGTVSNPSWGVTPGAPVTGSGTAVSMTLDNLLSGVAPVDADNAFTLMFWLKTSDFGGGFQRIFCIGNDTLSGSEAIFAAEDASIFEVYYYPTNSVGANESEIFSGTDDFLTDQWQHHAAVVDGLSLKWYVDAVEKGSGTMATNVTSSAFYILGSPSQTNNGIGGSVDEVGVFDEALDQTAIQGFMNDGIGGDGIGGDGVGTLIMFK